MNFPPCKCIYIFYLFALFFNQAIIIVCVLSMRKQPYISREPWNWILGILGPGHWWDMSTWKWRTHLPLFRLIGELVGGWGGAGGCDVRSLYWACKSLTLIPPSYQSLFHFLDMPLRSISGTTEPGMALGRPMKSLRCHFIAFIITGELTSFGKSGHLTVFVVGRADTFSFDGY